MIQQVVSRKSGRVDIKRQAARQIPSSYAQDTSRQSSTTESGTRRQKEIRANDLRRGSTLYSSDSSRRDEQLSFLVQPNRRSLQVVIARRRNEEEKEKKQQPR